MSKSNDSTMLDANGVRKVQKFYHVTPSRNLQSIINQGLIPQIGARSQQIEGEICGIFCFKSLDDLDAAMSSWLGDLFDEDEQLSLIEVDPTDAIMANPDDCAEFEVVFTTPIGPNNLKVLSEDIDIYIF